MRVSELGKKRERGNNCWVCKRDLSKNMCTIQANLIANTEQWREEFDNSKYKFYFPEENQTTCNDCFKNLSAWKSTTGQINYIRKRALTGSPPKLKFPVAVEYDKCTICKQDTEYSTNTSIYSRKHYITGIGQFCPSCYMATANTGIVMREFYNDYLF